MATVSTNAVEGAPGVGDGRGSFHGEPGTLFNILIKGVLLTILTLGIYRFWMKTHLRQYYWGSTRLDGEPMEYTGRGIELLLGFMIAIFFLAIYLAAVNFGLSFASMAYWQGYEPAIFLSFLTVVPLIPYAKYRAQRYLLSRTRWKGVRFGLDLDAWSYTWRSLLWSLASIVSLGLLMPLADFKLRQFITSRMTFGDQRFRLTGKAGGLYRGYLWVWGLVVLTIALFAVGGAQIETDQFGAPVPAADGGGGGLFIALGVFAYIAAFVAFLWYGAFQLKYILSRMEVAGAEAEPARLQSDLSPRKLTLVMIGGLLLTMLITIAVMVGAGLLLGVIVAAVGASNPDLFANMMADPGAGEPDAVFMIAIFGVGLLFYVIAGVAAVISAEIFINRRFVEKTVETVRVENVAAMNAARQQAQTKEESAEGFADALDVGAF